MAQWLRQASYGHELEVMSLYPGRVEPEACSFLSKSYLNSIYQLPGHQSIREPVHVQLRLLR